MMDQSYLQVISNLLSNEEEGEMMPRYGQSVMSHEPNYDDFLAAGSDFIAKDRAFSWDATFEDLGAYDPMNGNPGGQMGYMKQPRPEQYGDSVHRFHELFEHIGRKRTLSTGESMYGDPNGVAAMNAAYMMSSQQPMMMMSSQQHPHASHPHLMNQHSHHSTHGMQHQQQHGGLQMPMPMQMQIPMSMHMQMSMQQPMGMGHDMNLLKAENMLENPAEIRIGAYTKLERKLRIERFRAKKHRRVWKKQIKYDCRKKLADTRPRIKGRFVSRKGDGDSEEGSGGREENEEGETTEQDAATAALSGVLQMAAAAAATGAVSAPTLNSLVGVNLNGQSTMNTPAPLQELIMSQPFGTAMSFSTSAAAPSLAILDQQEVAPRPDAAALSYSGEEGGGSDANTLSGAAAGIMGSI
jgi:hypothetical protein